MCATVVTIKTKHTVGGRKVSSGRLDMHMPVTETNLHNMTMYQKQRLFSFNCKCLQKLIMWLIYINISLLTKKVSIRLFFS